MSERYSEIRSEIKTGDIVLFSGSGPVSDIIKLTTLSKWSHVGMVLLLPEYDFLTIWESTTLSGAKDLSTGAPRKGVQLASLSDRVQRYSGDIAVRRLQGGALEDDSLKRLMALRNELKGRRYERSKFELFKSAFDGPFGRNSEDLASVFCSELVAEAYQRLGLFSEKVPSNEYTPADFGQKKLNNLRNGFSLSNEIMIEYD